MAEDNERQELIDLIHRGIDGLVAVDDIPNAEKIAIIREALNVLENSKKQVEVQ